MSIEVQGVVVLALLVVSAVVGIVGVWVIEKSPLGKVGLKINSSNIV